MINDTDKKTKKIVCGHCFRNNLWIGDLPICPITNKFWCWSCTQSYGPDMISEIKNGRIIEVEA
jgi:hypothetical protein